MRFSASVNKVLLLSLIFCTLAAYPAEKKVLTSSFTKPAGFEPNLGQSTDKSIRYLAHGRGYQMVLKDDSVVFALSTESKPIDKFKISSNTTLVGIKLLGQDSGRKANIQPEDPLPGRMNYFQGNDPSRWTTDVPTYGRLRYRDVYPGIDLLYYRSKEGELEHDFIVASGADPKKIAMSFGGVSKIKVNANGDLVVSALGGVELHLKKPFAYQETGDGRKAIDVGFKVRRGYEVSFDVGEYDRTQELVIDPVLVYSTYFGGPNGTSIYAVAADSSGNSYVGGTTYGGLPLLSQLSVGLGPGFENIPQGFVSKFNAAGQLVYSTYLGAVSGAAVVSIAVDASGNAYLTGAAGTGFPTTGGVVQATNHGDKDFFVTKLGPNGNALVYSTYLGGSGTEFADAPGLFHDLAITIDSSNNAYIAGLSGSNDFPVVNGTGQVSNQGTPGGVVAAKLNSTATVLSYSTYVGNTHGPVGGVAVDPNGNLYIVGAIVQTAEFATTVGAYQTFKQGYDDGFAVKLGPTGSIVYATYLGGTGSSDGAFNVVADAAGNAYVLGYSTSLDFPVKNAFQSSCKGILICIDAFLLRLNPTGSDIDFSTYLGGTGNPFNSTAPGGNDYGYGIAIDANGIYVAGETLTPDFPTLNPLQASCKRDGAGNCTSDAFVTQFSTSGALLFSTYLGGTGTDRAYGVAVDGNGNIFVAGTTDSTNFPRLNAYANSYPSPGASSSFLTKISTAPAAPGLTPNPTGLTFSSQIVNTTSTTQPVTLTSSGNTSVDVTSITVSGDFLQSNNCPLTLSLGATCTVQVSFRPGAVGLREGDLTIPSTAGTKTVTLSGTGQAPPDISLSPASLTFGSVSTGSSSAAQTVTMTNTSGTPVAIASIIGSSDFGVTTNCGSSLAAAANCAIFVTFSPVGGGPRAGSLTINSNAQGNPHIVSLIGTGLAPGANIFPAALDFGSVQVGNSSISQQILVTSNGSQPLTISGVSLTGANAASFTRFTNCVTTLVVGASCTIDVVFAPTVRGANAATLTFSANAALATVSLTGTGLGPGLSFNPTSLPFPTTTVGNSSPEQSTVLTNTGDTAVAIDLFQLQPSVDFKTRDNCPPVLNQGQNCTVFVRFVPRALGGTAKSANLNLTSGTPGLPAGQKTIGLSGTAVIPAISVAPASVDFGTRGTGQSANVQLVVVNLSGSTITMGSKTFTGTNPASFSTTSDGCNVNLTVNSNNCGVVAVFTASGAEGARTANFNIPYTGAAGSPLVVSLTGQVTTSSPILTFSNPASPSDPTFMFFSLVNLFSTSAAQTLTITNSGSTTANISSVQISGPFSYSTTCTTTLLAGASCTYTVAYAPVTTLSTAGRIVITSDAPGSPHTIVMLGTVGNPTPLVDAISPNTVTAGSAGFNLIVTGSRFITGATVRVNGNDRVTNFLNSNQLIATIPAGDIANAGTLQITAFNPGPGGGNSAPSPLTVLANLPPVGAVETAVGVVTGTASVAQNTNLAVTGWAGDPEDGSPVTQVQMQMLPPGVTDVSGIYIADTNNNLIRRVDSFGKITTVAGTGLAGLTGDNGLAINAKIDLAGITGVTAAANGDLYICDINNDRLRKVTAATGIITTIAGGGATLNEGGLASQALLFNPINTAINGAGDIYIIVAQAVRKIAAGTGIITTVAGDANTGTASFSGDSGLATSARLANPVALAFDSSGHLFIADAGNNRIRRVDKNTNIITTFAGTGNNAFNNDGLTATATNIYGPYGIAFDAQDNLFLASIGQDRIRKIAAGTNIVSTIAGNGVRTFSGDNGPATSASLNLPRGIALDSSGILFISDNGNNRVRRVDLSSGQITTFAGTGATGNTGDGGLATAATFNAPQWISANGATSASGGGTANASLGTPRPDVANAQNNGNYLNSGWTVTANIGIPAPGSYSVRAVATDSKGASAILGPSKSITVTPGSYALARTAASSLDVGSHVMNRLGQPKSLNITNDGNAPLTVSSVVSASPEFITATNCNAIAPAATCQIVVSLQATGSPGIRNSTVTINSNDPTGPKLINVTGNGIEINLSLTRPRRPSRTNSPSAAREFDVMVLAAGVSIVGLSCESPVREFVCRVEPGVLDLRVRDSASVTISPRSIRSARLSRPINPPTSIKFTVIIDGEKQIFTVDF